MTRRAAKITQADLARAIRAAEQVAPGRRVVEITPDGLIRIVPIEASGPVVSDTGHDEPEDPFARGREIVP
jgi:hypothetical protein